MAEGVGNAPTSGLSRSCFRDRCSQLVSACLPEMVRVERMGFPSLASQMPDQNGSLREQQSTPVLLLSRRWPRANARLLLTLHPEIGCQTWTRTKTNGLTDRRATLTPPGNGAGLPPASFRLEGGCLMCSATTAFEIGQRGRICTCGHPVPSRACCCYTTCCSPRRPEGHRGLISWRRRDAHIEPESRGKIWKLADPKGVAPSTLPQTTGRSAD